MEIPSSTLRQKWITKCTMQTQVLYTHQDLSNTVPIGLNSQCYVHIAVLAIHVSGGLVHPQGANHGVALAAAAWRRLELLNWATGSKCATRSCTIFKVDLQGSRMSSSWKAAGWTSFNHRTLSLQQNAQYAYKDKTFHNTESIASRCKQSCIVLT